MNMKYDMKDEEEMMKKKKKKKEGRIVVMVPYPALGHVGPMQKLASAIVKQGVVEEAVIIIPKYLLLLHRRRKNKEEEEEEEGIIKWVGVEDGSGIVAEAAAPDFFAIESAMENIMPSHLEEMLKSSSVMCVVVDLLASWAIQVAERCGIPAAGYWPAMLSTFHLFSSIPHFLRSALISPSGLPEHEGNIRFVGELPIISSEELPWLIGSVGAKKGRFKFWIRTMERCRSLKWLLVNSFPDENIHQLQSELGGYDNDPRVFPISPICSNENESRNMMMRFCMEEEEEERRCLKWLERQKGGSVVYISFGSWVSPIGEQKVKNLALSMEASGRPFLWVLKPNWRQDLPIGFVDRVFNRGIGMLVSWAPQAEVLQHESVGCYITHCGWNSTLEALQFKKRMLCYPVAGDQFLNCAYIVQVWRVGLRLNGLGLNDVEDGLSRVMDDNEMGKRLMKLNEVIMGTNGDNARGASILKAFVDGIISTNK